MWSGVCTSKLVIRRYMTAASPNENPHTIMVILMGVSLEPDPQKIGKEHLANRAGWKCILCGMLGIFNCRILQACRVFC